jgi:ribosomal protein L18E
VLARGELSKPLTVHAHAFSKAAREKIEGAGGTCQVVSAERETSSEAGGRARKSGRGADSSAEVTP